MSFRNRTTNVYQPPESQRQPSIPQRQRVRQQLGPFTYAANSAAAGFEELMTVYCGSDVSGQSAYAYLRYVAPYDGCIVGMTATSNRNGSNLSTPIVFQAYVNEDGVNAYMTLPLQASQTATFSNDDSTRQFKAGDEIEVLFSGSTSTATIPSAYTVLFWLTVEM